MMGLDIVLVAAIGVALMVTILCAALQKSALYDDNHEYEQFLDGNNDHQYYDRSAIRNRDRGGEESSKYDNDKN